MYFDKAISETPVAFKQELVNLLHGVKDKLHFICNGDIDDIHFQEILDKKKSKYLPLEVDDYFKICKKIRNQDKEIQDNMFVIILTNKTCDKKLISGTDGKNIFINVEELMKYASDKSYYPIAYQIVENIFQALNKITYSPSIFEDKRLHLVPIGCINDLCMNKEDVVLKLSKASICKDCLETSKKNKLPKDIIEAFKNLLKHLHDHNEHFNNSNFIKNTMLSVSSTGDITIKGKYVKIEPKPKAYFIFFLLNQGTYTVKELESNSEKIAKIYKVLKSKGKEDIRNVSVKESVEGIKKSFKIENKTSHFTTYRSDIYKAFGAHIISKTITDREQELFDIKLGYRIQVKQSNKKINEQIEVYTFELDESLFSIHDNFKE